MSVLRPKAPCGTWRRYSNGCRCDECRIAWRRYCRERSRLRGVRPREALRTGRTHGIRTTYVKGCRWHYCTEAERLYRADLRRRQRRVAA